MVLVGWWDTVRLVYMVDGEEGIEDSDGDLEAPKNCG